jgi:hypothetical protein
MPTSTARFMGLECGNATLARADARADGER